MMLRRLAESSTTAEAEVVFEKLAAGAGTRKLEDSRAAEDAAEMVEAFLRLGTTGKNLPAPTDDLLATDVLDHVRLRRKAKGAERNLLLHQLKTCPRVRENSLSLGNNFRVFNIAPP